MSGKWECCYEEQSVTMSANSNCSEKSEPISKPNNNCTKYSNHFFYHHRSKLNSFTKHNSRFSNLKCRHFEIIKQSQPRGIIFIWPQKKSFYYEREYTFCVKLLAQMLYWCQEIGLFPSGTGLPIKRPPWDIKSPPPKPENRDYIIEPDWNSII